MEVPVVGTGEASTAKPAGLATKAAGCWNSNKSLWIGLTVLLLGVVGQVLIYALPGESYVYSEAGGYFYSHDQLLGCLRVVASSAVYVGAFWVGAYMAFWGFRKK